MKHALKAVWTKDAAKDMKKSHGLSMEEMMTEELDRVARDMIERLHSGIVIDETRFTKRRAKRIEISNKE
jgi:hypothetical protein